MIYRVTGIRLPFQADQQSSLDKELARLGLGPGLVKGWNISRRSLDSRRKNDIHYQYQLEVETHKPLSKMAKGVALLELPVQPRRRPLSPGGPVVVVGAGPAGLFAALSLAELGLEPLVLERGRPVEQRSQDVDRFWSQGQLDPESNMQFGEGGAGTFSDGKLTTRTRHPLTEKVFRELVAAGAPEEILYDYKPHIGTDLLVTVVASLRRKIQNLGGRFQFGARVADWKQDGTGRINTLVLASGEEIPAAWVVLATGHSARDTYALLHRQGVQMEAKAFAVGTRIEHPQELINKMQYGPHWQDKRLPTATYSFTHNVAEAAGNRGVFSFCMCPGGEVVSAASEPGRTLVNGMSESRRDGAFANSALVVSVGPQDFGPGLFDGLAFQQRLEESLYQRAGGYGATFQRLMDYRQDRPSQGPVESSFRMELVPGNLRESLPPVVVRGLDSALGAWSRVENYVNPAAVLIGHETRTSSPLRIVRDERGVSLSHPNLVPAGEGAGYAGGIASAAVDGLRVVEQVFTEPVE